MILNLYEEGTRGEFLNEIGTKTEKAGFERRHNVCDILDTKWRLCILDAKWRLCILDAKCRL